MAIEKTIVLNVDSTKGVQGVKNLNTELNNTNKTVNETKADMSGISGVADNVTGGAVSKFKGLTGVIGNVSKGFGTLKGAIISTGIGALVILIGSLIAAFTSSEEGQNKFAKLMGVIGSVVGNVMDVISDLGEVIIGIFSGDSKAIKSATEFGKKIFDVVGLPIKNIITVIETLAKTLGALFSGDISGAFDQLKSGVNEIGNNFNSAKDAINSGANALKNFGQEALKEAQIAQQIADQRAKADVTERNLIVQRAEGDRKIAELREKSVQRDIYTTSQRIKMLKDAQAIENNLTNQEVAAAKLRADAKTKENALSKSTKEQLLEEENLKAKVIQLETQRLQANKRLTTQIVTLQAEERAAAKATTDAKKKQLQDELKLKEDAIKKETEAEKTKQDAIEAIRKTYLQKIQDLEDTTESEKVIRQESRALAELEKLNATEQQKVELLNYYSGLKVEAAKKDGEKITANEKAEADAKKAIQMATIDTAAQGIGLIKTLFEKNKGIQKAALIAESAIGISKIVINTQAANAAARLKYALLPGGAALAAAEITLNKIGAGIGIATNIAATAKGLSALGGGSAKGGASLGGDNGGGTNAPVMATPQFNVVGNNGVNQIAQTLGNQQPIQAYVVANNVTTAQSLDRNIIQNASLG